MSKRTLVVCVTGAAGQIGYSLCFNIARGLVFGDDQPVALQLLDIPPVMEVLNGVKMELEDCALPLLTNVLCTADPKESFQNADVALLVGSMPRKQGMERKDLLKANGAIFKEQGLAMKEVASKDIKVLVVGNPANTNALIAMHYCDTIPRENFTALTRLDHNRAAAQIALRLNVSVARVKNVIIWGNHSSTQYPDVSHGYVVDYPKPGTNTPIRAAIQDDAWLDGDFIKTVQQRGAAVINARKQSSAMSAAKAIVDHVHDWWVGTAGDDWVSMGVPSDGSYGIKEGIVYSFPVRISKGKYTIVKDLPIGDFAREKMNVTQNELLEEREDALNFLEH